MVLLPKNFLPAEHRNLWATVVKVERDFLTLRTMRHEFTTATDAVSARRGLNVNQRWNILNRDRFRCRVCGCGMGPGRSLHVDHAESFHEGGTTENLDNLWTLCSLCNAGKNSASMEKISAEPLLSRTELNDGHDLVKTLIKKSAAGESIPSIEINAVLDFADKLAEEMDRIENNALGTPPLP